MAEYQKYKILPICRTNRRKNEAEDVIQKERKEEREILQRKIGNLKINLVNKIKHISNYHFFLSQNNKNNYIHIMKISPFHEIK